MASFFSNNGAVGAAAPAPPPEDGQFRVVMGGRHMTVPELVHYAQNNADVLADLSQRNAPLVELILENKVDEIERFLRFNAEQQRRIQDLHNRIAANPFDVEAQRLLEEEIRERNVAANYEQAMEQHPEFFGSVYMLYIDTVVNSVPVKAFVDSGAQSTIMSEQCAERCGIMRLIDRRFAGMATGVGTAPIVGRVHAAPIAIGSHTFAASFTIMRSQGVDFLLGLDFLRRHRCCIDLRNNTLSIGDISVPFLGESDIPTHERSPAAATASPTASQVPARPSAAAPSAAQSSAPPAQGTRSWAQELVIPLVELGFSERQARSALDEAGGDPEAAASILLNSAESPK